MLVAPLVGCGTGAAGDLSVPLESTVRITSSPALTFPHDRDADDIALGRIGGATRLSNGTIAVLDGSSQHILLVDSTGSLVRTVGRQGGGPGEFTGAYFLAQCQPDSLFVHDASLGRMSVFDSNGDYVRQFQPPRPPTRIAACDPSGPFAHLYNDDGFIMPSAEAPLQYFDVLLVRESGDSVGGVAHVPFARNRPLTTITQFALDAERLIIGTADSGHVSVYTLSGSPSGRLDLGITPRRTTAPHYDQAIEALIATVTGPSAADQEMAKVLRRMMHTIGMPEFLPTYSQVLVDPTGTVWAVTSSLGDPVTELRAVSRDNRRLGVVHLPVGLLIHEVGLDYVLAATADTAEEPRVLVFRLTRGEW